MRAPAPSDRCWPHSSYKRVRGACCACEHNGLSFPGSVNSSLGIKWREHWYCETVVALHADAAHSTACTTTLSTASAPLLEHLSFIFIWLNFPDTSCTIHKTPLYTGSNINYNPFIVSRMTSLRPASWCVVCAAKEQSVSPWETEASLSTQLERMDARLLVKIMFHLKETHHTCECGPVCSILCKLIGDVPDTRVPDHVINIGDCSNSQNHQHTWNYGWIPAV